MPCVQELLLVLAVARLLQVPPLCPLGHPSALVGETQLQVCSGDVGNAMKRCSCLELPGFGWQTQGVTKPTEQQRWKIWERLWEGLSMEVPECWERVLICPHTWGQTWGCSWQQNTGI